MTLFIMKRHWVRYLLYMPPQNIEKSTILGEELASVKEEPVGRHFLRPLPPHAQCVRHGRELSYARAVNNTAAVMQGVVGCGCCDDRSDKMMPESKLNGVRCSWAVSHSLCSLQNRTTQPESGSALQIIQWQKNQGKQGAMEGVVPETIVLIGFGSSCMVRKTS